MAPTTRRQARLEKPHDPTKPQSTDANQARRQLLRTRIYKRSSPSTLTYKYVKDFPSLLNRKAVSTRLALGMVNRNNDCFQIATLQALFHIPIFLNWLNQHHADCMVPPSSRKCLACWLYHTASQIWNGTRTDPIKNWQAEFRGVAARQTPRPTFLNGQQQDCADFLRWLLDILRHNYDLPTGMIPALFEPNIEPSNTYAPCGHVYPGPHSSELVFPVTVVNDSAKHLEQLLKEACESTIQDASCGACHHKGTNTRQDSLVALPEVLIFHLSLYDMRRGTKLQRQVDYPEKLDLGSLSRVAPARYRLRSVIVHAGELEGGHYYSFCKGPTGPIRANDDRVSRCSNDDLLSPPKGKGRYLPTPYILMYTLDG